MEINAYFVSLLVTESIFYVFHLSILYLLIVKRHNKFQGPFYDIFRIVLFADFVTFINSLIGQRFILLSCLNNFYKESIFLPLFIIPFTPFVLGIQFFGKMFMAMNRFTSIWFPLKYEKVWQKHWYTVLLVLIPFLSVCWRLHESVRFTFLSNGAFLAVYAHPNLQPIIKGLASLIYFSTTMAGAIFNGLSFAKFYYNKRKTGSYSMNEQRLLFISVIIFFAQIGRTSYALQQYLFPTNENVIAFFASILPYLNDALALSGSISLFLLSKIARKEYAAFYFNKKFNSVFHTKSTTMAAMITKSAMTKTPSVMHK